MHISDFDYVLPPELIASEPARPRDTSRMLVVGPADGPFTDSTFRRIGEFLRPDDVLVVNDTRVVRARLFCIVERTDGRTRPIELLFSNPVSDGGWEVLCKPGKRIRTGDRAMLEDGSLVGTFGPTTAQGLRLLMIAEKVSIPDLLEQFGQVPLPPYITRPGEERDRTEYQTLFAVEPGAIAAPTAGLHFTSDVENELRNSGVRILPITLHVGIGTFQPVREEDPSRHFLRPESFRISAETADALNEARACGRRIVAVGTTSTRTLEHVFGERGRFSAMVGKADRFILPGYSFRAIDGLLTNFHLPRSTLLMLVCAFSSRERILVAYRHAVEQRYRFYSYGDCMLLFQ